MQELARAKTAEATAQGRAAEAHAEAKREAAAARAENSRLEQARLRTKRLPNLPRSPPDLP